FESPGFRKELHRWQLSELKRRILGRAAEPHLMFPAKPVAEHTRLDEVLTSVDEGLATDSARASASDSCKAAGSSTLTHA
ncbi:MAG: hypothetical protein NXI04_24060, partial [Planctomycetaceae bacterium]|nr:hypothetical protein [Planctomycetaceae bacterium]